MANYSIVNSSASYSQTQTQILVAQNLILNFSLFYLNNSPMAAVVENVANNLEIAVFYAPGFDGAIKGLSDKQKESARQVDYDVAFFNDMHVLTKTKPGLPQSHKSFHELGLDKYFNHSCGAR